MTNVATARRTRPSGVAQRPSFAAIALAGLLGWSGYATVQVAALGRDAKADGATLARVSADLAAARRDSAALRADIARTAQRMEARNAQIAALIAPDGAADARLVMASAPAQPDTGDAADPLAPLVAAEGRQLALARQAAAAADARYQSTRTLIVRLGLDSRRFAPQSRIAMGGPLEEARGGPAGAAAMADLLQSWNRLSQLGAATLSLPSRLPVATFTMTSGFGVRYDPFNGRAAMHAGVDFAGAHGEPVVAAAEGVVVRAGWAGGYGNVVDIDHGRGMSTRYGHLSRVQVRVGDRVVAGDQIGKMGSTGRSTGTHLHFEIRVDGQAVDPMPYLRAAPQIAAAQQLARQAMGGPAATAATATPLPAPVRVPAPAAPGPAAPMSPIP
jgi:murein DD-endopeptidase MepM/ murein hydrolase activator NlpD